MENKKKLLFLGVAGIVAIGIYKLVKYVYKREEKILEKEIETERQELASVGIEVEAVEKDLDPLIDSGNLVKSMYSGLRHNPDWDLSQIEGENSFIYSKDDRILKRKDHVIYLTQSIDPYSKKETLDFILEIPPKACDRANVWKCPTIGDYMDIFKNIARVEMWNIIKYVPSPNYNLEGYLVICFDSIDVVNNQIIGEGDQIMVPIPKKYLESYKNEKKDGLSDFVLEFSQGRIDPDSLDITELYESIAQAAPNCIESWCNIKIIDVMLAWRCSFKIRKTRKDTGISIDTATKCLSYLLNDLEVVRRNGPDFPGVRYSNVVFCAYSERYSAWSKMDYYELNEEDGGIDIVESSLGN